MKNEKSGSIWDGLPDAWIENKLEQESKKTSKIIETNEVIDYPKTVQDINKKQIDMVNLKSTPENPEDGKKSTEKSSNTRNRFSEREEAKEQRERERKYEKLSHENKLNSSSKVRREYEKEHQGNKKDFIILGVIFITVIILLIICVGIFMNASNQKIYSMIDSGSYGSAYQLICDRYESGKNVDDIVYTYVDRCINDSEYKRAVAALEMLSDDAGNNMNFFDQTVETLILHDKSNRAEDVLSFLNNRGEDFQKIAQEISEKYTELY